MLYDPNALFGIYPVNVNLGVSIANLWLEKLDRTQALAMKAAKDYTASTRKAAATLAANRNLSALMPLQAELMHEPIAQFTHFWQAVVAEMQNSQSTAVDDLRLAAREWQASCADSMNSLADHPWVAHAYRPWVDAASLTWEPLSANWRHMFTQPAAHASETEDAHASARPRAQ
ncbi:hypothetical protein [Dyella subtropica]|uniref:hypothetical protein n=1 Tax=Dyella subtropica TaxID=2992127 RepID=UPI00225010CB|nr:hypothetical protein [Dyella subtropica]